MGQFKLKKITEVKELALESELPESDYSFRDNGKFYQFEYIPESSSNKTKYEVVPGIYTIFKTQVGYSLETTSYSQDSILASFINTKQIENVVDSFFDNLHLYKEFGIEIPKRGVVLFGPVGTGKTTALSTCIRKYNADGKTAIISWPSYKYEAYEVKDFFQTFEYKGVDKVILIVEDLGGIENENNRLKADSSLLSLLDNQEKTFTLPVMIIATTNYPENLAESIMNRPGRFDDKIRIGFPEADARVELLKFFSKGTASDDCLALVKSDKCKEFTPAELRESYIRSRLRGEELITVIKRILKEKEEFKKAYSQSGKFGI